MEEIVSAVTTAGQSTLGFFKSEGFPLGLGALIVLLLTFLVKIPIKKWAKKKVEETQAALKKKAEAEGTTYTENADETTSTKLYTWIVNLLALAMSIVYGVLCQWFLSGWCIEFWSESNWVIVMAFAAGVYGGSQTLYQIYEQVKVLIVAKIKSDVSGQTEYVETTKAEEAEAEAAKKAEEEATAAAKKAEELRAKKAAIIAEQKAKLAEEEAKLAAEANLAK